MFNWQMQAFTTELEPLITPQELSQRLPVSASARHWIDESRAAVARILEGKDNRRLLVLGPCSIHDILSARDYAVKLRELAQEVKDSFFIVMRTFCEKPRSSLGWKGLLNDPDLNGSCNIAKGIILTRQLLIDLAELRVPAAAELLDPLMIPYTQELLSWGCVGARTSASQIHRQLASSVPFAVGFKNDTSGNVSVAVHGALSASMPHCFPYIDRFGRLASIQTVGNPLSHIILRGSDSSTNYDHQSMIEATQLLSKLELPQRLLVDCSHGNAPHGEKQQIATFRELIPMLQVERSSLRGILLESHLVGGNQSIANPKHHYGQSITDRCLNWASTVEVVQEVHECLQKTTSPLTV